MVSDQDFDIISAAGPHAAGRAAVRPLVEDPRISVPSDPPIYHITHVDNLSGIVREGGLWCDSQRVARKLGSTNIGHAHIKGRRLTRQVDTTAGGMLGDYVPFNFCPRSVMLFAVHKGHKDYTGGQENVVHLISSVRRAVALQRQWAFTDAMQSSRTHCILTTSRSYPKCHGT